MDEVGGVSNTRSCLRLHYEQWLALVDALEATATEAQRESAQDVVQGNAPRLWINAIEARDEAL